jgi:hypothetical protein
MIKPLATMLFIWGLIMFLITSFNYLNNPGFIEYNNAVKYSMVDSGMSFAFLISTIMMVGGFTLLRVSRVPRDV